jgi:hypothetical protein
MGIALTVLIGLCLVSLTLYLKREEWFNKNQKKGAGTVSDSTPTSAAATNREKIVKEKETKSKESTGPVWKFFRPILGFALGVGLALWVGFSVYRHFSPAGRGSIFSRASATNFSYDVPVEIALRIIGDCESPGEPGGKQFNADGSVVRGTVDRDDVGALQTNTRLHADLIKEIGIDPTKSKEDNYRFGRVLVEKFHGYGPWFKTQNCWGPKLAGLGFGQGRELATFTREFEAPVGKPSEEVDVIGYDFSWGKSEGSFIIENDKGAQARFDPDNNLFEDLPHLDRGEKRGFSRKVKCQSLTDKPAKVIMVFNKQFGS